MTPDDADESGGLADGTYGADGPLWQLMRAPIPLTDLIIFGTLTTFQHSYKNSITLYKYTIRGYKQAAGKSLLGSRITH